MPLETEEGIAGAGKGRENAQGKGNRAGSETGEHWVARGQWCVGGVNGSVQTLGDTNMGPCNQPPTSFLSGGKNPDFKV